MGAVAEPVEEGLGTRRWGLHVGYLSGATDGWAEGARPVVDGE